MDLSHYFNRVDFSSVDLNEQNFPKNSIGSSVVWASKNQALNEFREFEVAILGVPLDNGCKGVDSALAPDEIRDELYRLPLPGKLAKMVDFGNLNPGKSLKSNLLALRDIVGYLAELGMPTIVLGGSQELTVGVCDAFKNNKFFTLSVVDAVLDVKNGVERFNSSNFLTRIFKSYPTLFHFNLLAFQRQLVQQDALNNAVGVNNNLSLGNLRDEFAEVEPALRNTTALSFDFGAIKYADAQGSKQKRPNGLRSEEACQLAKYAGLSDKLQVFGLFESLPQEDHSGVTSKLSAEIVWYFLEGVTQRSNIKKWISEDKKIYRVEIDQLDKPLVFFEDQKSDRWWYEIESVTGEKTTLACSAREYAKASANEIPELWLKYVQKMDELSK